MLHQFRDPISCKNLSGVQSDHWVDAEFCNCSKFLGSCKKGNNRIPNLFLPLHYLKQQRSILNPMQYYHHLNPKNHSQIGYHYHIGNLSSCEPHKPPINCTESDIRWIRQEHLIGSTKSRKFYVISTLDSNDKQIENLEQLHHLERLIKIGCRKNELNKSINLYTQIIYLSTN